MTIEIEAGASQMQFTMKPLVVHAFFGGQPLNIRLRAGKRLRDLQSGSTFEETFQKFADSIFASGHLLFLNTNRISAHSLSDSV